MIFGCVINSCYVLCVVSSMQTCLKYFDTLCSPNVNSLLERAHHKKTHAKISKKALQTIFFQDVGEQDFYTNIVGSEQMKLKLIQNSRSSVREARAKYTKYAHTVCVVYNKIGAFVDH